MSDQYVGEIKMFTGAFAPRDWAQCDGAALSQTDYSELFSVIGTTYGGDATTFNLPDLRGRVPIHAGQGPGLSTYNLGTAGGVESVTLTQAQLPAHNHDLQSRSGPSTSHSPAGNFLAQPNAGAAYKNANDAVAMAAATMPTPAPSNAHSNIGPYQAVNFIIALVGVYPSP